jgi:hypothetical protein
MTAEWKLLCVDAINICGRKNIDCLKCEVRCTEIIKAAQRKLLEYLIANSSLVEGYGTIPHRRISKGVMESMLKQLEAK